MRVAPTIAYPAVRVRWCRDALVGFLRRWGVQVLVVAMLVGAGASGAWAAVTGIAAWLVLPLFAAAAHPAWLLPAVAGQAALGAACLLAVRALVWQPAWADAERAWPIPRRHLVLTDAALVAVALLPLWLLQAGGAAALLSHQPAWLQAVRVRAVLSLLVSMGITLAFGMVWLHRRRRAPRSRPGRGARLAPSSGRGLGPPVLHWTVALVLLPLRHGPAQRSGRLWAGLTLGLGLTVLGAAWHPSATGWWLAGHAAGALAGASHLAALVREELSPLVDPASTLPLPAAWRRYAAIGVAMLPVLTSLACWPFALSEGEVRTAVLAAYTLACAGACALEAAVPINDPATAASRWMVSLVLCVALASEVMA